MATDRARSTPDDDRRATPPRRVAYAHLMIDPRRSDAARRGAVLRRRRQEYVAQRVADLRAAEGRAPTPTELAAFRADARVRIVAPPR